MAYKNFVEESLTLTRDVVFLPISIPTNGGANPVAANVRGLGYVVTRPSLGIYTLTPIAGLKMPNAPTVHVSQLFAAVAGQSVIASIVISTGVITLSYVTTATLAAVDWPAAGANSLVSVLVTFSNSQQLPSHS